MVAGLDFDVEVDKPSSVQASDGCWVCVLHWEAAGLAGLLTERELAGCQRAVLGLAYKAMPILKALRGCVMQA